MKNHLIYKTKSKVLLKVEGKNIERFIKRLINNKIELLKIKPIKYNEMNILVYQTDVSKILELKSIYDVTEKDIYGIIRMKQIISSYKYIIMFFVVAVITLIILSRFIFSIEVVHNSTDIRQLITNELSEYKISKFHFKKSFKEIQQIKTNILEKYKDKIEWLEIIENGTKYIVRLEERIIPDIKKDETKKHVIAKKSAIIKKIIAQNGEVIREINEYVNKGDIVISGNVSLFDNVKNTVSASGTIYGEVWYTVSVSYPFVYSEIKETGNTKKAYTFKFLNKEIELGKNHYLEKRVDNKVLWNHSFLPISFNSQFQKEIITFSEALTEQQALDKAFIKASDKMKEFLKEDEAILNSNILKKDVFEDKIEVTVFFSVLENITDYMVIDEVE